MVPAASQSPSPLDRFLRLFTNVRPGEGLTAVLLALNIFLILTAYYLLKPVREALILGQGSAELKSYMSAGITRGTRHWTRKLPGVFASHPVYEYFARRYELNLESVHFEPDEVPDEIAWSELEALVSQRPAQWMIWEAEPLPEVRDRLDAMGIGVVVFDPCATPPATGDFLSAMRDNVANLERVNVTR